MSFNRLPDELVAQMASHLNHEDVINFAQSQKRIYNILKRYKLMKPRIFELRLDVRMGNFGSPVFCAVVKETEDGPLIVIQKENPEATMEDLVLEWVPKFRSIALLNIANEGRGPYLRLNDVFIEKLAATKVKIQQFELFGGRVDLTGDQFVSFCKKFKKVKFFRPSPTLICDKIVCEILATTIVDLYLDIRHPLDLTDKTLQVIANGKSKSRFRIYKDFSKTKFTVAGIREFIENIINKDWEYGWALGQLLNNQFDEAVGWMNYVDQHPELPYAVFVINATNGYWFCRVENKATGRSILTFLL